MYRIGIQHSKDLDQRGNKPSPSGLMARTDAGSIVSMEVLVEQQMILPMGILLEFLDTSEDRATAVLVTQKDAAQPCRDISGNLEKVLLDARTGWAFDLEVIAVVSEVMQQRPDDQGVDRHPDGSPPVLVAAKHPGVRFSGKIAHSVFLPTR